MIKKAFYLILLGGAVFWFLNSTYFLETQYLFAKSLSESETLKLLVTSDWLRTTGPEGFQETKQYTFNTNDKTYLLRTNSDPYLDEHGTWVVNKGDKGIKLVLKPQLKNQVDPYIKFNFSRDKVLLYDDDYTSPHIYSAVVKQ